MILMNKARYFTLRDDGALWKCSDCQKRKPADAVLAIELVDGRKMLICRRCIDEDWLAEFAEFAGQK